jgi:hypothetical protein
VRRVSHYWKKIVDCDARLLSYLDFSDPTNVHRAHHPITTHVICEMIKVAGKRLSTLSIWNHCQDSCSIESSSWNLDVIYDTVRKTLRSSTASIPTSTTSKTIVPSPTIFKVILAGHQSHDAVVTLISILQPTIVEFATCTCIDIRHLSKRSIHVKHSINCDSDDGGDGVVINGGATDVMDIEWRFQCASYGTFICNAIETGCVHVPLTKSWYRQCPLCHDIYCLRCSTAWAWSNQLYWENICVCSLCWSNDKDTSNTTTCATTTTSNSNSSRLLPKYACSVHCHKCHG